METVSGAAEVSHRSSRCGLTDRRSRFGKVDRRSNLAGWVESESLQSDLPALVLGLVPGSSPTDRSWPGSGTVALPRRFNRPDLGSHCALAQNAQAASRARFGRSTTAAPSGSGDSAALVELRDGFLPLSDAAVGRTTVVAARSVASDA